MEINNNVSQLLAQIRVLSAQSDAPVASPVAQSGGAAKASFADALMASVNKVNEMQMSAGKMASAFERGESDVDVAEVMVAMQKASIGFQAMTQVRNRLISAYQDVMNMPV